MSDIDEESHGSGVDTKAVVPRFESGPPQTSTSELAAGLSRWLEASSSFLYVELSSLILLLACALDWRSTVWHKYALSVACVSLIVCLLLQTAEFMVPGFLDSLAVKQQEDGTGGHSVQKVCSIFLLLWWVVGTGIITFHAPFVVTSNGWFGAWGGLLATAKWCIGIKEGVYGDQPEGLKQLYNISICSLVLLLASIPPILQKWENWGGAGFGIAVSALTLTGCAYLVTMYSDVRKDVMKITAVLFTVLWVCVAMITTFHGPFLVTNNGFFAAWLGCLCSLNLTLALMRDGSPENYT